MADALAVYAQARRRLIEEQGAEPGAELVQLQQRILRRDPDLAVVHASARSAHGPVADTLPPGASEFIGRVEEIRRLTVDAGADGTPLIEIIEGMAGIGKTALAIYVARSHVGQHCDGRLYLNFLGHVPGQAPLPAAEAARRLLQMSGVHDARIPSGFEERAALWRAEMARRGLTVIWDDVRDLEQIRRLLPEVGDCLILITTRRRIRGIRGTRGLTLGALHFDEARTLFVQITGAERIGDPAAADEAVRLCAGLPLAIHVVAARLRQAPSLSVAEMVEDLSRARGQPGQAVAAYEQLKQAFDLSYEALAPSQQRMFRQLGAYPCTEITLQTAAALDEARHPDAERALDGLLGHHLLEEAAPGRFRCHDMIRAYAMSLTVREDSAGRRKAVCRVLDYYLYTADRADRMRYPHRHRPPLPAQGRPVGIPSIETPEAAHQWLESEWRNILEAARHAGEHEWQWHCVSLAHVLAGFLDASGYWHDAVGLHEVALRACRDLDDSREIARASINLSHVSQQTGRYEKAARHADEAANIYRSLGDRRGEAEALDRLGIIHDYSSKFLQALAYYQEAQSAYRDAGDRRGVADTLLHAGIVCWCLGRPREAITQLHEALDLYRFTGDRRGEAKALNNIGEIQRYRGFHRDAVQRYEESLAIFREIGGRQNEAQLHHNMAIVFQYKGDTEKALSSYRSALATYRDIGDLRNQADVLNNIGAAFQSVERHEEALANHQRALEIAEAIGNRYEQVIAMRGAADARRASGHYAEAVDRYHRVLKIAREVGDPYQEAKILNGIAEALLHINGRDARIYWRQALDIFSRLGVPEAESVNLRLQATGADPP